MKRDAAQTIFRTVVFAGAMLGAGCGKKAAPATPMSPASSDAAAPAGGESPPTTEAASPDPCAGGGDPCGADPCAGGERPRGSDEDGGGGMGRGFILA